MKLPASLFAAAVLAVSALSAAAQQAPAAAPAKADANLGGQKYEAVCLACHGNEGNSAIPANPKLAQQHPEYMVKQLQDFKTGKRPSPIMQPIAAQLSDADMKNIAAWAAARKAKAGMAKDKALVALGEKIWRGGVAERQIAACAGCHSPNGAGVPAQYPRLAGQHGDYTEAQLRAFRDGTRPNSVQMTQVAARLNDREIRAVADYIAGLR